MPGSSFNNKEFEISLSKITSFEAGVGASKFREKNERELLLKKAEKPNKETSDIISSKKKKRQSLH